MSEFEFDSKELKEKGNLSFKSGDYVQSKSYYQAAMKRHQKSHTNELEDVFILSYINSLLF
jgi:hypothetical protein